MKVDGNPVFFLINKYKSRGTKKCNQLKIMIKVDDGKFSTVSRVYKYRGKILIYLLFFLLKKKRKEEDTWVRVSI